LRTEHHRGEQDSEIQMCKMQVSELCGGKAKFITCPDLAMAHRVVSGVTGEPTAMVYRGSYPYIIGLSICLLIPLFFPGISLWLPNLFIK